MMKKWLWLLVSSLVLLATFIIMELGPTHFGKSYTESEEFKISYLYYTDRLLALGLAPPEEEAEILITAEEIEEYRNRYGSLADQVDNIQMQYADQIEQAKASGNSSVEEILVKERDRKIEAIQSNFADDDVVREKITEERLQELAELKRSKEGERPYFQADNSYYVYRLKNLKTGETFTQGELSENPFFEMNYTSRQPLADTEMDYGRGDAEGFLTSGEYEGTIQIDHGLLAASNAGMELNKFTLSKSVLYLSFAVVAAGLVILFTVLKFRLEWFTFSSLYEKWKRWSIEVRLIAFLLSIFYALYAPYSAIYALHSSWNDSYAINIVNSILEFGLALMAIALALLQGIYLFAYYKKPGLLRNEFQNSLIHRNLLVMRQAFLNKTIGVQMLILLIVIFFWGFGTLLTVVVPGMVLLWIPATLLIGIPVLVMMMKRFGYLNVLMQETEAMAMGQLNQPVPVSGNSPLANHARQLNRLKEGVRVSMTEQAKSERLKTELITNVSHDLRTPLTSIITYTDLLKAPDLSDEDRLSYAAILDRKSQRLKTLIEDLFEVSKMASGNMELQRSKLDVAQLLQQALAEHAEDICQSGLDFRVSLPERPIQVYADGQKWWRVLDNLILNAIKYALPGTRVYVTLEEMEGQAQFIIKNITRYELGENPDELFERFKRGDASRQTEGSGLGLAIAQSIVELHGGTMKIEVDGDLFKVTVTINSL
ncbi:sensor histidine kinase [Planococcus sp. FY231025]|uniref:sensor histidine kinase n=1 Tax=Planococcus sp. FY231025 TaxID=3455699 RepID=UPI003F900782